MSKLNFLIKRLLKLIQQSFTTNILGIGRDDETITKIITSSTRKQNILLDLLYRQENNQNQSLYDKLETLGGSYGLFLSLLTQSISSIYASLIRRALEGFSTDTSLLNEIFCLISFEELSEAGSIYNGRFGENLRDKLQSKLSGTKNHLYLLIQLLQVGRNQNQDVDEAAAVEQAKKFHAILTNTNLIGGLSDETHTELSNLMLSLSVSQAQLVKREFSILFPTLPSLETFIANKVGGGLQQALQYMLLVPSEIYARKIKDACTGLRTDEETISRVIGSRNARDVEEIAAIYQRNFNSDMIGLLKNQTSGKFRDALVSYLAHLQNDMDDDNLLGFLLEFDVYSLNRYPADHAYQPTNLLEVIASRTKTQLQITDKIYREKNNRQSLNDYLSNIKGPDRRQVKKFYRYVIVDGIEVDVKAIHRALNLDPDSTGIDISAIVETLCSKSADRLVAARELYEKLHDATFLDKIQAALASEPILSYIIMALISHNRHEISERTDYDDGTPEEIINDINTAMNEPTDEKLHDIATILLTHSPTQNKEIAQVYENTFHKNLEREVLLKFSGLVGVALNSLFLDPSAFLARRIHASINNPDTINRLIGGTDKSTLQEIVTQYQEHFHLDLLTSIANAYPNQKEYVDAVTTWITSPGYPEI